MDGRFTALSAELITWNVGAPFHLRGEEQVFARLYNSGNYVCQTRRLGDSETRR